MLPSAAVQSAGSGAAAPPRPPRNGAAVFPPYAAVQPSLFTLPFPLSSLQCACHSSQLFSRRAAVPLFGNQRLQRWCFDVELLWLAEQVRVLVEGGWQRHLRFPSLCLEESIEGVFSALLAHSRSGPMHPPLPRPFCLTFPLTHTPFAPLTLFHAAQFEIPVVEVPVHWTEMPGSKIRATSILDMAWEMLTLKVGCGGCARMRGRWGVGDGREGSAYAQVWEGTAVMCCSNEEVWDRWECFAQVLLACYHSGRGGCGTTAKVQRGKARVQCALALPHSLSMTLCSQ